MVQVLGSRDTRGSAENRRGPVQRRVFKAPSRLCPGELRRMQGESEMGGDEEDVDR